MLQGVHTALVTPFSDGKFDEPAFRRLIDRQFSEGVAGIVPVGTTGESPTLDYEEHLRVVEVAVEQAQGRGQVIAGTGSNCTKEAVELTLAAEKLGATGSLQVCPYYNKPSQEGLFRHFQTIAEATKLKIVLYSVPGRSGIAIGVDTVIRLAQACPNIVAIKEAGGSADRVSQIAAEAPPHFEILSGDDSLTLPFMSVGAVGVISVASNLIPGPMSQLVQAANSGDYKAAAVLHRKYCPLLDGLMKLDTNPVPIKTALALVGQMKEEFRLPLVPMDKGKRSELAKLLEKFSLIRP